MNSPKNCWKILQRFFERTSPGRLFENIGKLSRTPAGTLLWSFGEPPLLLKFFTVEMYVSNAIQNNLRSDRTLLPLLDCSWWNCYNFKFIANLFVQTIIFSVFCAIKPNNLFNVQLLLLLLLYWILFNFNCSYLLRLYLFSSLLLCCRHHSVR